MAARYGSGRKRPRYSYTAGRIARAVARHAVPVAARYVRDQVWKRWNGKGTQLRHVPSVPARRRRARKRWITRGSLRPKFKKPRIRPTKTATKFSKSGAILKYQLGGVAQDGTAPIVFIGHATVPQDEGMKVLAMALIRKLLKMAGTEIEDWGALPATGTYDHGEITFRWQNFPQQGPQVNSYTQVWTAGQSVHDAAISMVANWKTQIQFADQAAMYDIKWVPFTDTIGNNNEGTHAYIKFSQLSFEFKSYSNLAIQNRTEAASVAGEDNRNNVTNNPLTGKMYHSTGNGMTFRLNEDTGFGETLLADGTTGIIAPLYSSMAARQQNAYRMPPAGRDIVGCKRESGIYLNPGNIRSSKLISTNVISSDKYWNQMSDVFRIDASSLGRTKCTLGKSQVLAMQLRCNVGAGEGTISIGYEVERTIECYIRCRPYNVAPFVVQG